VTDANWMSATDLPKGDRTPRLFAVPQTSLKEQLKKPVRRWGYPVLNAVRTRQLAKLYASRVPFRVDLWLLGQRGNDYEAHRRYVNARLPVAGTSILVDGCGTGSDLPSWFQYHPKRITGVDYFDYSRAWSLMKAQASVEAPQTGIDFHQGDIAKLPFAESTFDIVASDAVLEHVSNLPGVIAEAERVLRPGGVFYSCWGALWNCFGGDHISGHDGVLVNGFNHLLLSKEEYDAYLASWGPYEHDADDGRTWVMNGLFSYLKAAEYVECISRHFDVCRTEIIIDPRAVEFMERFPEKARVLRERVANPMDLLIAGMTMVGVKRR
jgi:SAM-dependent methyltransferase